MTADLTHLILALAVIPVVAAIAVFFYWLGHHHGRRSVTHRAVQPAESEPKAHPLPPEIPAYRIKELATLLDLGILTPEEFEQAKGNLYANGSATSAR